MDKQRIEYLHQRYLEGKLSREEAADWEHVLHAEEYAGTIHAMMYTTWTAITPQNQQSIPGNRAHRIFRQVIKPSSRIHTLRPWLGAAAILVVVSAAFWFFQVPSPSQKEVVTTHDVAPGGNRATLSLTDGTTIDLSEAQAGIVVGDKITYLDGSVVEHGTETAEAGELTASEYTLQTPHGVTYQVTLPDGTNVWLNAASTLTYPSRFSATERRVTLAGEAYFSVTKDVDKPFIVYSRDQRTAVVGTEFNINAYPDEDITATTLISGRVNVAATGGNEAELPAVHHLSPGQQSVLRQSRFRIQEVDTDQYTAWRDGRFNFDGKTLPEVMRELARWYGIKVAYQGTLPDLVFYGGAQRNNNLAMVMTLLETNGISYHLTPDTILVLSAANGKP